MPSRGNPAGVPQLVHRRLVVCNNRGVSWSILQTLFTTCALLAGVVFIAAFKFALRETTKTRVHSFEPEIPRAELHGVGRQPGNQWHRGAGKQKLIGQLQVAQAALVAIGITSIFVMFLCMTGIVTLMLFGTW